MVMWKCTGCGYIHEDDAAPEQCPKCGAPREAFQQIDEGTEALIVKSRATNHAWMELTGMLEDAYELAETIQEENLDPNCVALAERSMQDFEEIIQSIKAELAGHMAKNKWG